MIGISFTIIALAAILMGKFQFDVSKILFPSFKTR